MDVLYPNLAAEIAKRGVKKKVIASTLGISGRALYSKMRGIAPFTWEEVCILQNEFFPDKEKDVLFEKADDIDERKRA